MIGEWVYKANDSRVFRVVGRDPNGWHLQSWDGLTTFRNYPGSWITPLTFDECEDLGLDGTLRDWT